MKSAALAACAACLGWLGGAGAAWAGGGPENVLLVVNASDQGSKTIANHYVQLRSIPPGNVLYLDAKTWNGSDARIDIDTFRDKILRPIAAELENRKLQTQIDYIIYSSEFPWAINFTADLPPALRSAQLYQNAEGSITGLTFLIGELSKRAAIDYAGFNPNYYMRLRDRYQGKVYEIPVGTQGDSKGLIPGAPDTGPKPTTETVNESSVGSHGFRSWYGWSEDGDLNEAGGGRRYMLSAMLGVTYGRGNSLTEVLNYLQRSATADGTFPSGTVYFMDNPGEIRSQTRKPGFELAKNLLRQLGVKAEITAGDVPRNRPDVQGLMTGVPAFDWPASGSTIRPGAICENFTSYGGIFDPNAGQTPLSVFLKYGAAGTSGTVIEPFAFQNKFPHAMIQVHYARGCTLAEAFYQSVYSPYQLIVVGDPLCRPWANIPQVRVEGVAAGDTLKGTVTMHPKATLPRQGSVNRFELFLDGMRIATTNAEDPLELDTTKSADGYHELRIVGIESSPIESQGRIILPVQFNNNGRSMTFETSPEKRVRAGGVIKLFAKAPGAHGVAIYQNNQVVAKFVGADGEATVDTTTLGEGPVTLQAAGWEASNSASPFVYSAPVTLNIEGPLPKEPAAATKGQSRKAMFEK